MYVLYMAGVKWGDTGWHRVTQGLKLLTHSEKKSTICTIKIFNGKKWIWLCRTWWNIRFLTRKHDKGLFLSYLFRNILVMWLPLVYKLWDPVRMRIEGPFIQYWEGIDNTFKESRPKRVKSTTSIIRYKLTNVALATAIIRNECLCFLDIVKLRTKRGFLLSRNKSAADTLYICVDENENSLKCLF